MQNLNSCNILNLKIIESTLLITFVLYLKYFKLIIMITIIQKSLNQIVQIIFINNCKSKKFIYVLLLFIF